MVSHCEKMVLAVAIFYQDPKMGCSARSELLPLPTPIGTSDSLHSRVLSPEALAIGLRG